jgi:hypothetical protein
MWTLLLREHLSKMVQPHRVLRIEPLRMVLRPASWMAQWLRCLDPCRELVPKPAWRSALGRLGGGGRVRISCLFCFLLCCFCVCYEI